MIELTDDMIDDFLATAEKPVLIDFHASWCGPCKRVGPILAGIAEERDDVIIVKLDVDANRTSARKFGIQAMPTMKLVKAAEVKATLMGAKPKDQIVAFLDEALK